MMEESEFEEEKYNLEIKEEKFNLEIKFRDISRV